MEISELTYIIFFGIIIIILLILFLVYVWQQYYKRNTNYINHMKTLELQYKQELLQTQIEIQEQTLTTISQEIHDNIGQVLSLAKLNLNTLQPGEHEKLKDTKMLVSKAINDLRDLSRSMHGDKIADLGLQEAIANELKILQNTGQFITELKSTGQPYKILPQKEMVLFRIVQEAMNNAIKYSRAKTIGIIIEYQAKQLLLTISDNGVGFDTNNTSPATTGLGLKSMQNRAHLIGAHLTIQSQPHEGTKIKIELPLS
jgi:two-component system NarL family sensor kinase